MTRSQHGLPSINTSEDVFYYYTSCVGALIGIAIISLLFSHICYHFIQTFYRFDELNTRKRGALPFILFFLLSVVALFFFIQFAFVRNSLITGQSSDSFTSLQCGIGFFGAMIAGIVASILTYFILLHRIRLGFDDSIHRLSDTTYWALNISFAVTMLIGIYPIFTNYQSTEFQLEFYDSTHPEIVYCAVTADPDNGGGEILNMVAYCIYIGALGLYSLILLYLFTSRLYALQTALIKQHLSDQQRSRGMMISPLPPMSPSMECHHCSSTTQMVISQHIHLSSNSPLTPPPPIAGHIPSMPSISENGASVDITPTDSLRECPELELDLEVMSNSAASALSADHSGCPSLCHSVNDSLGDYRTQFSLSVIPNSPKMRVDTVDFQSTKQMSMTIEEVDGMKDHDQSAQTIYDYHSLTKKHSILVLTMVLSAVVWLVLLVTINPDQFFQESVVVAIIWIIGIWLGFGASKWYWKCMTQYFLCALCYRNKKRAVDARVCYICYC